MDALLGRLTELGYLKNGRSDSRIRHFQNYRNNFKSYKYQMVVGYKYPTYADYSFQTTSVRCFSIFLVMPVFEPSYSC